RIGYGGPRSVALAPTRTLRLGRSGRARVTLRLLSPARKRLRAAVARCGRARVAATVRARHAHGRAKRTLSGGSGCHPQGSPGGAVPVPGQGPPVGNQGTPGGGGGSPVGSDSSPTFSAGAAVADFTPPLHGKFANDASDCDPTGAFDGPRKWAFTEPYKDQQGSGHFDQGDPYLDCNQNGRWDGNLIGGGSSTPRFYTASADPVTSRALVVGNGKQRIAVEVTDQEGLFNVYQQAIRDKVNADLATKHLGPLDGIFVSATHDESAPDSLGLGGVDATTSGTNDYWLYDWFIPKSAQAIEDAYAGQRPAHIHFAEAIEPPNMRQCWSSYPYVDDQLMPVLQAVGTDGSPIATLASVSQHAETLGFNSDPTQKTWLSADWPHFFRQSLEQRYGGVAIEMAGSVGSVESPQVFPSELSRTPQHYLDGDQPAGCRTMFDAIGKHATLGYDGETRVFGQQLAAAVGDRLDSGATDSASGDIWGARQDVCIDLTNALFKAAAAAGVFAHRPAYAPGCTAELPPSPTGTVAGASLKTDVAAFRIGDGEFMSLPGEVFPFTYLRSFMGPDDMPDPQYGLPPWPLPHMNAPYRFFDGLGEDMIGYIFPRGNGVGVPGEDPSNPMPSGDDRFGCHHSDDSEAATSQAADVLAPPLLGLIDAHDKHDNTESQVTGRYVLPDGAVSRDPLGGPELKCTQDMTFHPDGPAVAVDVPGQGVVHPAAWMSLSGRPQTAPDRNTRGYFTASGTRVWLDVFPAVTVP
ncbi:MAG: hypothetical protein QOF37_1044, partial [Thermoleophilaceae bacterium]|nr:hypothetical protein [Thermoleophilaceae bacterium]